MDAYGSDGDSSDDAVLNSMDKAEDSDSVLRRRLNELAKAKGTLEFQNQVLQRERDAHRIDMEELLKENRLLTRRWTLAIKQSEEVNKDRRSAVEDLMKAKSKNRLLENEIWRLRQHKYVAEEEKDKLLNENGSVTHAIMNHDNMMQDLTKEQNARRTVQNELDDLKKESRTREDEVERLRAENVLVTRALTDHQSTMEVLREEKHSLEKKLEESKKQSRVKEEEIKVLREEMVHVTRALADIRNFAESLKTEQPEKQTLQEELDRLKKDSCMKEEEINKLRAENSRVTCAFADHQNTLEDLKREQNEKCILQGAVDELKKEMCTRDEKIEQLSAENMHITRVLTDHQNTMQVLNIEQAEKQTLQEELDQLKKDICTREEEINKLRGENARVTRALTEHINEKSVLSANFDRTGSELTSLLEKYSAPPNSTQVESKSSTNVRDNHGGHVTMLGDILHKFNLNVRKAEADLKKERTKNRTVEEEVRRLKKDVQAMAEQNRTLGSEISRLTLSLQEQMNEKSVLCAHLRRAASSLTVLVEKYCATLNSGNGVSNPAQHTSNHVHVQEKQNSSFEDVLQTLHSNLATLEDLLSQLTLNLSSAVEDLKREQSKSRAQNESVHRSKKEDEAAEEKRKQLNIEIWWLQHAFRVELYNLSQLSFYGPMVDEIRRAVQTIESAVLNFQKAIFESSESPEANNKG